MTTGTATTMALSVAKSTFAAACLNHDPTPISKDEIALFHSLILEAALQCSPSNVQKCKNWLSTNIANSRVRTIAFAKYLAALSLSFDVSGVVRDDQVNARPPKHRKRLYLLYLVNDVLHHTKYHEASFTREYNFAEAVQPHLLTVVGSARSCPERSRLRHHKKLQELLDLWEESGYFGNNLLKELRQKFESTDGAETLGQDEGASSNHLLPDEVEEETEQPWVFPEYHGDIDTVWHDLPAACIIPSIDADRPIDSEDVRPMRLPTGPMPPPTIKAVEGLLDFAAQLYDPKWKYDIDADPADTDQLGNDVDGSGKASDQVMDYTYYGFSPEWCEREKATAARRAEEDVDDQKMRGRSRHGNIQRRGTSSSQSLSRSRHRSRSRSGSYDGYQQQASSRRPLSPPRGLGAYSRSSPRNSRSRSPYDSDRADRTMHDRRGLAGQPSLATTQKQPQQSYRPNPGFMQQQDASLLTPINQIDNPFPNMMPPPPQAQLQPHNFPIGPNGLPIPPPPPFHTGPWPPPPPNMPMGTTFNPGHHPNFQVPPFLPPPPPNLQGNWSSTPPQPGHTSSPATPQIYQQSPDQYNGSYGQKSARGNWHRG